MHVMIMLTAEQIFIASLPLHAQGHSIGLGWLVGLGYDHSVM